LSRSVERAIKKARTTLGERSADPIGSGLIRYRRRPLSSLASALEVHAG